MAVRNHGMRVVFEQRYLLTSLISLNLIHVQLLSHGIILSRIFLISITIAIF